MAAMAISSLSSASDSDPVRMLAMCMWAPDMGHSHIMPFSLNVSRIRCDSIPMANAVAICVVMPKFNARAQIADVHKATKMIVCVKPRCCVTADTVVEIVRAATLDFDRVDRG